MGLDVGVGVQGGVVGGMGAGEGVGRRLRTVSSARDLLRRMR